MAKAKAPANTLGSFLQQKRQAAGHSQWDVSEKLGYSTAQFISNWERGVSAPPINILKKIAQLYNTSADELFEVVLSEKIQDIERDLRRRFNGK